MAALMDLLVNRLFSSCSTPALLMVSPFSYNSFKEISISGRISFTYALALPLIFIMIAVNPPLVLFGLALTYALAGPAFSIWRRHRRKVRRAARANDLENID